VPTTPSSRRYSTGLAEYGALEDTLVVAGGIIPEGDRPPLLDAGLDRVFGPGASMDEMVAFIREHAPDR